MGVNRVRLIKSRPDGFVENLGDGLTRTFDSVRNQWTYSVTCTVTCPVSVEFTEDDPIRMLWVIKSSMAGTLRKLAHELEVYG